ncbi:hypothetical protein R0131_16270 [Clostridium sp. AL.422]|nr:MULTISPECIES: hypothetical protein [unclassified Clostridium]MDV4152383.1 hypothetical protein [Clostridium sp. AL.422]
MAKLLVKAEVIKDKEYRSYYETCSEIKAILINIVKNSRASIDINDRGIV